MSSILERNKKVNISKKTREDYMEDALYREVWEDVNNEKTQKFLKKYWKYILVTILGILLIVFSYQMYVRSVYSSKLAMAQSYENAVMVLDANALENMAKNSKGGVADLALFQSYLLDKDINKLKLLVEKASSRDFSDLARLHIAALTCGKMSGEECEKYLSVINTKKSPFFYSANLLIAEKYLSVNDRDKADKFLNVILNGEDTPVAILTTAQMLK